MSENSELKNIMLNKAKLSLRISTDVFDEEIIGLIESAKIDLLTAGISQSSVDKTDAMVELAILTYCRAHFGMANPDSEKYAESYDIQRNKLAVSGVHNVL